MSRERDMRTDCHGQPLTERRLARRIERYARDDARAQPRIRAGIRNYRAVWRGRAMIRHLRAKHGGRLFGLRGRPAGLEAEQAFGELCTGYQRWIEIPGAMAGARATGAEKRIRDAFLYACIATLCESGLSARGHLVDALANGLGISEGTVRRAWCERRAEIVRHKSP